VDAIESRDIYKDIEQTVVDKVASDVFKDLEKKFLKYDKIYQAF